MSFPRALLCCFFVMSILVSCDDTNGQNGADSIPGSANIATSPDFTSSLNLTVKTFAATDSTGMQLGWGYDLYVNGKRTIHQPIIPAVPGNDAFATEEEAKRTGELAVYKMKLTGAFPTITINELDSLGIRHK